MAKLGHQRTEKRQGQGGILKNLILFAILLSTGVCLGAEPPVGRWNWSYTEETADEVTTPDEAGYTVAREFHADFTYREFLNGDIVREGIYWVEDVEHLHAIIPALRIQVEGDPLDACAFYNHGTRLSLLWGSGENGFPSFPAENLLLVDGVSVSVHEWGSIKSLYR